MFEDEIPVGKAEDLRGKTYNRLTVLYRVKNNGKKVRWKCQCECGNTTIVERMNLTSGHTKSCGCYKTNVIRKNLVGQRFGKLTVVKATNERDYNREIIWECLCDCGNTAFVPSRRLTYGTTQSCGCYHKEVISSDLTGQRFGKLVVLGPTEERSSGKAIMWKCQCDCGNIHITSTSHLGQGTESCGCTTSAVDLTGQRFGKLVAIKPTEKRSGSFIVWECKCDCGNIAYVSVGNLRKEGGTKSCGCIKSTGETIVGILLRNNDISYEQQKTFDSCRFESGGLGKFDFYVNNHYLIEYDGIQHFEAIDFFGGNDQLLTQQERDMYKNQWCKDNNIPLIRIPYTKLDTLCIEDLLLETTQFRVV